MHSHSDEHQEKAKSLGLPAGVVLQNLTEDVETDVSVLVNEVANSMRESGSTATPSVDDNLIQSIVESEAFKAAAASVGVSAAAPSSSSSSVTTASTLFNNGGATVSEATVTILHTAGELGGVAVQSPNVVGNNEQ